MKIWTWNSISHAASTNHQVTKLNYHQLCNVNVHISKFCTKLAYRDQLTNETFYIWCTKVHSGTNSIEIFCSICLRLAHRLRKYHTAAKQEHITAERTNRTTQSCRGNPQPNPTTVQNSDVANIDGSGGSHTLRPSYSSSSQSSSSSLQRTPEKQLASSSTTLVLITNTNPNRSKSSGARAPMPHVLRGAAPDEAERACDRTAKLNSLIKCNGHHLNALGVLA